jgi:hypothetical protein
MFFPDSPYMRCQNLCWDATPEQNKNLVRLSYKNLINWCFFLYDKYYVKKIHEQDTISTRDTLINSLINHVDKHYADHIENVNYDYLSDGGFFILLFLTARGDIGFQGAIDPYQYKEYHVLCYDLKVDWSLVDIKAKEIQESYEELVNGERKLLLKTRVEHKIC